MSAPLSLQNFFYVYKGRYGEAFQKHQQNGRVSMEYLKEWQESLIKASYIVGRPFKSDERWIPTLLFCHIWNIYFGSFGSHFLFFCGLFVSDLGKFLEDIVQLVLKIVKLEPFEVGTYPVGLEEAADDFQNKKSTKIVVIVTEVNSS